MSILSIISPVTSIITSLIDRKREKTKARHDRDLAVINNQARLASSKAEFNHSWEMASLKDKDVFLRNLSFILFTSPVLIAVLAPVYAAEMFTNLKQIPEWLLHIWFYMISGVWGIATLKDSVTEIVHNIRKK